MAASFSLPACAIIFHAARDKYHDAVRNALIKDGWTITHDPLRLIWGKRDMYVDLGAKCLLAAEKDSRQIAVEIKSFAGNSEMADLEKALGQFTLYRTVIDEIEPERTLYLAVPQRVIESLFQDDIGKLILREKLVQVIGFDPAEETLVQWIN
ncbi:MAG: element excision factor XisH family protein [Janthinobacterium lividum]